MMWSIIITLKIFHNLRDEIYEDDKLYTVEKIKNIFFFFHSRLICSIWRKSRTNVVVSWFILKITGCLKLSVACLYKYNKLWRLTQLKWTMRRHFMGFLAAEQLHALRVNSCEAYQARVGLIKCKCTVNSLFLLHYVPIKKVLCEF